MRRGRTALESGVAALLVVVTGAGSAQEPQQPVFPASVDLASFEVTVVDANGAPVRDLGPDDFTLSVDGKPRRVVSAEFVAQGGGDDVPAAAPAPSHFSTNEGLVPGRLVLIAVDQGNIEAGGGRDAARAAGALLDRLGPADRVGLVTIPGPDPREEFTTDKARVRAALQKVTGRGRPLGSRQVSLLEALAYVEQDDPSRWEATLDRQCPNRSDVCVADLQFEAHNVVSEHRFQSQRSVEMLEGIFETLEPIETRKVVVLVSQGLTLPDTGSIAKPTPRLRELAQDAARARVALYSVRVRQGPGPGAEASNLDDVSTLEFEETRSMQEQGLEVLTAWAGGTVLGGAPGRAFERLAREISGHYLLGFEPEATDRDGKPRDVRVNVRRPGLTVRSRASLTLAPPAGPRADEQALVATLRSPVAATAIPLRVAAYVLREPQGDAARVLVSGEIGREPLAGLVVACAMIDQAGKVVASTVQRARADAAVASGPTPFSAVLSVPPARYTLKVAVRERLGRQGSVERPVSAAVTTAGGLEFSDLLLALPPSPGAGLRPGLGLERRDGSLLAHLELYGAGAAGAEVRLDVASNPTGPSVMDVPARLAAVPGSGRRVAQGLIPLEGLAPGDYVARATVSVAGSPAGTASHAFRVLPR